MISYSNQHDKAQWSLLLFMYLGFYVLQLQDYCVKAVQVLMIQNNVLFNHPNSNVYRSGHVFFV